MPCGQGSRGFLQDRMWAAIEIVWCWDERCQPVTEFVVICRGVLGHESGTLNSVTAYKRERSVECNQWLPLVRCLLLVRDLCPVGRPVVLRV